MCGVKLVKFVLSRRWKKDRKWKCQQAKQYIIIIITYVKLRRVRGRKKKVGAVRVERVCSVHARRRGRREKEEEGDWYRSSIGSFNARQSFARFSSQQLYRCTCTHLFNSSAQYPIHTVSFFYTFQVKSWSTWQLLAIAFYSCTDYYSGHEVAIRRERERTRDAIPFRFFYIFLSYMFYLIIAAWCIISLTRETSWGVEIPARPPCIVSLCKN